MEKATSAYISRAVSPVFFISIYIIIIAISSSSFGQDITEKRFQDPAMSIYNLKSLGIDLSDSINAIKRARDLGISEANIRKAILFTQNKSSLSDSSLVEEPILSEETEQEVGAETEITQIEPEQAEADTSIVITPDIFLGEGRWAGLRYFGYDVFQYGEDAVSPIEIGPVDPGYPIGAGDVIRLILWGEAEFQYEVEVNRDGNILIPKVGQVFVAGNRLDRLRTTLKNYLSKFYSGLSSDPPTIFMDATLARLRTNYIYIMGEINRPGAYAISSYATAFNALYYVRGPKLNGSLRNIRILREGSVAANIDIYDYILKGFSTDDRRLQNNDIVFVPTRGSTVGIAGEVTSPGIYELTEGESIKDLIDYARGLKPTAYTFRVQIDRIIPLKERIKGQVERKLIDIDIDSVLKNGETVFLADGDLVTVFSISEEMDNYVILSGEGVFRPGQYELNSDIKTLSDLVKAADGLKGDVYLNRAEIIRTRNDLEEEIIEVNLQDALRKNPSSDIELHRWDKIHIYSLHEMTDDLLVSLTGFVDEPGEYPFHHSMTCYDLIFIHAGLQDSLRRAQTYMKRGDIFRLGEDGKTRIIIPFSVRDVWNRKSGTDISLKRGDEIVLYDKDVRESGSRVVYLSGEVKKTGNFSCEENLTIADLLLKGGGFTEKAWIFDAEISRIPPEGISGDSLSHVFVVPLIGREKELFSREVMTDLILTRKTVASEFRLKPNDHVFIRANPDYEPLKTVSITGEVLYPGEYTIKSRNETLSELIERAGGVRKSAFLPGGQLVRKNQRVYIDFEKVIEKKNVKENIILLPGDQIVIPPKISTVTVIGEVINPGFYKYVKGMRIREYLNQSGGKTKYGDKVYVTEPSGRTHKLSIFTNMKVQEGSLITVRAKAPEKADKINWSEVVKDSFTILTGTLTIVYLIDRVSE